MIRSIKLINFKCFKELEIETRALNVLCGINGVGKSSIIQALLAVRQTWLSSTHQSLRLQFNGDLTELGTAGEVFCANPSSNNVEFLFVVDGHEQPFSLKARYNEANSKAYSLEAELQPGFKEFGDLNILGKEFNYLHAERAGPRTTFDIPADVGGAMNVGSEGQFAPFILAAKSREIEIRNDSILLEKSEGSIPSKLYDQFPLWMDKLFPGYGVDSEIFDRADQGRLGHALQRKQTGQHNFVRPTNTGFGLSFVLGVIVAGLVAAPGSVLIVENPEAHLHPRAQSGIGEFLARVAAGGAQVFVETHSEHVVNGMRRMIRQEQLAPDDLRLNYFSIARGESTPKVETITVSQNGSLSAWPDGFFDQLDKDLEELLG